MRKVNYVVAIGLVAFGLGLTSCSKDNSSSSSATTTQVTNVQDNAIASQTSENVNNEIDAVSNGSALKADFADTTNLPKDSIKWIAGAGKIVHWLCYNNIERLGKIKNGKISLTITYPTSGDTTDQKAWTRLITFDKFTDGGRQVAGTKTVKYLGKDSIGEPQWNITDSLTITLKNGKVITFNSSRKRTMTAGYLTPRLHADDVFRIDGNGGGVTRNGVAYTTKAIGVVKDFDCPYFKSGSIIFSSANVSDTVTFNGGASCSPSATISINGKTQTISGDTEAN